MSGQARGAFAQSIAVLGVARRRNYYLAQRFTDEAIYTLTAR